MVHTFSHLWAFRNRMHTAAIGAALRPGSGTRSDPIRRVARRSRGARGRADVAEHLRDLLARLGEEVLQVREERLRHRPVDERCREARFPAAPSAPDPVDIGVNLFGEVVVDDVADVGEVEALRGDVRGDEDVLLPVLERADGVVALRLVLRPVDRHGADAEAQQVLVDLVDIAPAVRKDEHGGRGLLENLAQVRQLRFGLHPLDLLAHIEVHGAGAPHVDLDGPHERAAGKVLDLERHGGAEQEGLPTLLKAVDHRTDAVLKAEVDKAVGLVHHEILAQTQADTPLLDKVRESPGSGDQVVDAVAYHLELPLHVLTPDAQKVAQAREPSPVQDLAKFVDNIVRLPCKLSL